MTNSRETYGEWGLVTGAARRFGLGEAFARQLAADGMNLVLVDVLESELNDRAQELRTEFSIEVRPVVLDLGREDILSELAIATNDLRIGLLVCNHYYLGAGTFHSVSLDQHLKMLDVNVRSYMLMAHFFGEKMIHDQRGGIVMVSSLAAIMPIPYNVHYSAFKGYISNMAEALSGELKQHGVNVISVVAPFMSTADARDSGFPPYLLDDTTKVARTTLKSLGKRSRIVPGLNSKVLYFVFVRLLGRSRGLAWFGQLIWNSIKDLVDVEQK